MTIKEIRKRYKNSNKDGYCEFCGEKLKYNKKGEIINKEKCKELFEGRII